MRLRRWQPDETWALLRAIYYERKDYDKAAKVLELLVDMQRVTPSPESAKRNC